MTKYYYKKSSKKNYKKVFRMAGLSMSIFGLGLVAYIFIPLVSYQFNFASVFASQKIASPIPTNNLANGSAQHDVLLAANSIADIDYTNAQNWFPTYTRIKEKAKVSSYLISIPKLGITNAEVSTVDDDLSKHLVNYAGTGTPPDHGNAVLFGHSTLESLFNPKNYKTIFATALNLTEGDKILVTVEGKTYTYQIFSTIVIDPTDTSVFAQTYDTSYLTIITCTPPGTVWKRLVIKSKLME